MKNSIIILCTIFLLATGGETLMAQGDSTVPVPSAKKNPPIKNTFGSNLVLENQTVMVPIKGSFEFVIQHKFGNVNNGFEDFYGLFAPSNIRLGFNYVPMDKLQLGTGLTKDRMQWDFNAKYALLKQTKSGNIPVSVSVFGEMAIDLRSSDNFVKNTDRINYFTQILIARKFCDRFSAQVAPSMTYFNNVEGYVDADGKIQPKMNNMHFAIAFLGRIKLNEKMYFLMNYDQPLTQHPTNNPHPNISFGLEMATSSHDFQIFMGNYDLILPASNNFYNQNDYRIREFQIGFNISRLWNF